MSWEKVGTIAFRNADQRVLWECELTGQISDGQWENSLPQDHWEAWCRAQSIVDPANVGYEGFYPRRDSYGFTRKEFLGVNADWTPNERGFYLAGRAMEYVRISRVVGSDDTNLIDNIQSALRWDIPPDYIHATTVKVIYRYGLEPLRAAASDESLYGIKDLVRDLRDMQGIIKVRRSAAA